jgi:hypothetical protein
VPPNRFQPIPIELRFWQRVVKTSRCWEWQGSRSRPGWHGVTMMDGKKIMAHRAPHPGRPVRPPSLR